jgi:hypothetical protein
MVSRRRMNSIEKGGRMLLLKTGIGSQDVGEWRAFVIIGSFLFPFFGNRGATGLAFCSEF